MNLAEVRRRILERADWQPDQSQAFIDRTNRFINLAYQDISDDAPFLLEDDVQIVTQPDFVSTAGSATDVLRVNASRSKILERNHDTATSGLTAFDTSGFWDGRMIEVTDSSGQIHRRRIREVWRDSLGGTNVADRISIDSPWPNLTDTGMSFRIFTPEYYLPPDAVEIKSARVWSDPNHLLAVGSQQDMERYQLIDYRGRVLGLPEVIFKGHHFQIDAPTKIPQVEVLEQHSLWAGPDPAGAFEYCFTYVWGKRDADFLEAGGVIEPLWESAPSPISDKIATTNNGQPIRITTPHIDHVAGFVGGSVEQHRSGFRKRIYARRSTIASDMRAGIEYQVEAPQIFFLLAEVDGHTLTYDHDGATLLDYYTRLKDVHGYQAVRLYPMPDQRYEIDMRVQFRPNPLVHNHDTPRIHEDAISALVHKSLSYFYEHDGNPEMAGFSEQRYRDNLATLTKRYGQISNYDLRRRPARVRKAARGVRRSRRVTYTGVT